MTKMGFPAFEYMTTVTMLFESTSNSDSGNPLNMKYLQTLILFLYSFSIFAQSEVKILSWNLKDFGKTKSAEEINFVAATVKGYDIIAVQEVVAGYGGPQAVASLADALNRTGSKWDYAISDPTSGSSPNKKERYAFFWKTARVKAVASFWLEKQYGKLIEREPFYGKFKVGNKTLVLANFHAITASQQPETEVKYFKFLPAQYPNENLIFCGDFNLPQSHTVFNPLKKMGYTSALQGQKTSLKTTYKDGSCLKSEFDNFYYKPSNIKLLKVGVIHFYRAFQDLEAARGVSDHVPVFGIFEV